MLFSQSTAAPQLLLLNMMMHPQHSLSAVIEDGFQNLSSHVFKTKTRAFFLRAVPGLYVPQHYAYAHLATGKHEGVKQANRHSEMNSGQTCNELHKGSAQSASSGRLVC